MYMPDDEAMSFRFAEMNGTATDMKEAFKLLEWIEDGWYDSNISFIMEALRMRAAEIGHAGRVGDSDPVDMFQLLSSNDLHPNDRCVIDVTRAGMTRSKYDGWEVQITKRNVKRHTCRRVKPDGTLGETIQVPVNMLVKIATPVQPVSNPAKRPTKRSKTTKRR